MGTSFIAPNVTNIDTISMSTLSLFARKCGAGCVGSSDAATVSLTARFRSVARPLPCGDAADGELSEWCLIKLETKNSHRGVYNNIILIYSRANQTNQTQFKKTKR